MSVGLFGEAGETRYTAVSARNDQAVHPGHDQSALIILLVQIQPSAQPGRGPLGFAGTGLTGCGGG